MIEENAKIIKTQLGPEDHGILTSFIFLDGANWGGGFGGRQLDGWKDFSKYLRKILEVAGADQWENLPGKHVRTRRDGGFTQLIAIGHITKNIWLDKGEMFDDEEKG